MENKSIVTDRAVGAGPLGSELVALSTQLSRCQYQLVVAAAAFAESAEWILDGSPTPVARYADAVAELLDSGTGKVDTEVIFHVRGDGTTTDDGTPICDTIIAQLVPDAFLRALIHDADNRPVNASGRQRHPTTRQRRVVKATGIAWTAAATTSSNTTTSPPTKPPTTPSSTNSNSAAPSATTGATTHLQPDRNRRRPRCGASNPCIALRERATNMLRNGFVARRVVCGGAL